MNLLTMEYLVYKVQRKVVAVLLIMILGVLIGMLVEWVMYFSTDTKLSKYADIDKQIAQVQQQVSAVDINIADLDTKIANLDNALNTEKVDLPSIGVLRPDSLLHNLLIGTNDGVKLFNATFIRDKMVIKGVANKIDEIAAFVQNLSKDYEVDITKTQQINHNGSTYYAFSVQIGVRKGY